MNTTNHSSKWAPDASRTPVLTENDIYLLEADLELNPILGCEREKHRLAYLMFDLINGATLEKSVRLQGLQGIPGRNEPATLPRVSELLILSRDSPWTTTVRNEKGVTVGDVWIGVFKALYEHNLADHEFNSLTARASEILRRTSLLHKRSFSDTLLPNHTTDFQPATAHRQSWNIDDWTIADRSRRKDCHRQRAYFKGLVLDDHFIQERQGFRLANMFVMELNV